MKLRTPNRENGNANLSRAKQKKDDEFYTDYCDIDRELCHYKDQLTGKVVYLPGFLFCAEKKPRRAYVLAPGQTAAASEFIDVRNRDQFFH